MKTIKLLPENLTFLFYIVHTNNHSINISINHRNNIKNNNIIQDAKKAEWVNKILQGKHSEFIKVPKVEKTLS